MIKRFLVIVILLASVAGIAQEHKINGTITGLENETLYLMGLMGERRNIIDTTQTDVTGAFTLIIPADREPGMYLVIKGPGQAVELIYNYEDIQFTISGFEAEDGIQIISSVENLIYYDYLVIKGMNMYKLDVLGTLINNYPPNDEFFFDALNQYELLQKQLNERIDELIDNNPLTLASRYLKTDRPIMVDPTLSDDEQNLFLKQYYFDGVDFNDTMLIRSTILTSKIVGYLSLYQNNANSQEELEDNMLMGVDSIFSHAQVNQQVYEFITDFLINGFESIGFEKGLEHIANASALDQFCENTERKLKLENKLELIKKLAIGQPAHDFTTIDIVGKEVSLSKINAKLTLLIFWASWCPHCDEIMDVIKSYYNEGKNFEVIAVSIDESKDDLMKSIEEGGYGWVQVAELQGWNGPIVEEYGIVATPTIFVLDESMKIIGKPLGERELVKFLPRDTIVR
ncbi:MAG: redoxin domain-containing protein [Bacteroidetes bacterium]|nr:redoxin domain-containing protein [Bacteroidota bacterium]MBL6943794.1 redoxin domain-containing protein [Bacteroidales bacterium]